jgi:hypothetical protein
MSNLTESQLESELQTTANIDKIRHVWRKIKLRERAEAIHAHIEDAQELNFDDLQGEH